MSQPDPQVNATNRLQVFYSIAGSPWQSCQISGPESLAPLAGAAALPNAAVCINWQHVVAASFSEDILRPLLAIVHAFPHVVGADGTPSRLPPGELQRFVPRSLPEIRTGTDELRVTDDTVAALAPRENLYQRAGQLVEIVESPPPPRCIERPDGGSRAVSLALPRLRELIADSASFLARKGAHWVPMRVPTHVVEQVAARGQWEGIANLEGIVDGPQFLADGRILFERGFDRESGLFVATRIALASLPSNPSQGDAQAAAQTLSEVTVDFPISQEAQSAWLAILLSSCARYAIGGPVPLLAIDANTRGSGKSLLADTIGVICTGRRLSRTTAPEDDAEMRKRITATLLAGESLVLLDNTTGALGTPALDALLTSNTWVDRILGKSTMTANMPATTIWLATGNNMVLQGDLARRALLIRINSPLENPELRRDFRHSDLLSWVLRHRAELTIAALTVLRAWDRAGRPEAGLEPWGSFEVWSRIIRNSIVFAGMPDPASTRQQISDTADSDASMLRRLLHVLSVSDPNGRGLTAGEFVRVATGDSQRSGVPQLHDVLVELVARDGQLQSQIKSLGKALSRFKERVCGGRMLTCRDTAAGKVWRVISTEPLAVRPDHAPPV